MNIEPIKNLINYIIKNYKTIKYDKSIIEFNNNDKNKLINLLQFKDLNNKKSYIGSEYIKLSNHIIIKFKCKLNVILNIYTYKDFNNDKLINNIVLRIYNMIELFYKGNNKNLIIYMLLYDCPRLIPITYKTSPLEMNDIYKNNLFNCINGWFKPAISLDNNDMEILITRLRTCEGLLIHELCHLCKLDFGGYDTFKEWDNYKKKYNITTNSKFTEGINNAISSIIHAIFTSIEDNNKNVKLYINSEYYYSRDLVGNLLNYFKVNNINELKKYYNQHSMMFEYIILRYCYLKYIYDLYHLNNKYENIININNKKKMNEYFNKFINKLKIIEYENIKFNNNMKIKINNKLTNFCRMEYYLF